MQMLIGRLPPTPLPTLKAYLHHLGATLKLIYTHYCFPDPLKVCYGFIRKMQAHQFLAIGYLHKRIAFCVYHVHVFVRWLKTLACPIEEASYPCTQHFIVSKKIGLFMEAQIRNPAGDRFYSELFAPSQFKYDSTQSICQCFD